MSTVGLNEATIAKYIREQESHDIALDKLSVKEYEDPFKSCLLYTSTANRANAPRNARNGTLRFGGSMP